MSNMIITISITTINDMIVMIRKQTPGISDKAAEALAEGLRASKSLEQLRLIV